MTWQNLGAIGEIVGGIGVILSLIYVAFQIRQRWWRTQAPGSLNPEFRTAVEAMLSEPARGRDES